MSPYNSQRDMAYAAEFPARHDAFVQLRTFVEETCAHAEIARADALRLLLLVEELFVNTVVHGHGGETDEPVRLALTVMPAAIAVRYEDTARAFDPFADAAAPSPAADTGDRRVGGLGVKLIVSMAADVRYVSEDGWNRITFELARSG